MSGRGCVIQRGDRWAVAISAGTHPDGRRRRDWHSGFATREEAERARTRLLAELDAGTLTAPSRIGVADYLTGVWLPAVELEVRASTFSTYRRVVDVYLVPRIGGRRLADLTPADVTGAYRQMLAGGGRNGSGLSTGTVRLAATVLHRALAYAVACGYVGRNVADVARPPRDTTPERTVWDAAQVRAFLASTAGDRLAALWHLAAMTGLRRGELLGLRWADLDGRLLTVTQARTAADYTVTVAAPKTAAGRRTVTLDESTVAALAEQRRRQVAEQLAAGAAWRNNDGLVFVEADGAPIHPQRLSKRFAAAVKAAGLPHATLHDLRHSHVTTLLRGGVDLRTAAARAGHASGTITLARYAHVVAGADAEAAMVAARALEG